MHSIPEDNVWLYPEAYVFFNSIILCALQNNFFKSQIYVWVDEICFYVLQTMENITREKKNTKLILKFKVINIKLPLCHIFKLQITGLFLLELCWLTKGQ